MKKNTKFSLPSKYILLLISLLCIGMMFVTFTTDIANGPLQTVTGYILVPIQKGINEIGLWFSDRAGELRQLRDVMAENEALQAQIDELMVENNALQQDKYELNRLRELYELDQTYPNYRKVAARIIGKDPGNWFHVFMIDKGTDDGLAVNMNVIAGGGLVGIITEVGPNWATVRSIIDDTSNVSAMVLSTSDRCAITGDLQMIPDNKIKMERLTDLDDNVQVGDKIVTSHISNKFLKGILIGYISDLEKDPNNLTKSGTVSPVVDFEHLEEVLVILDVKQ